VQPGDPPGHWLAQERLIIHMREALYSQDYVHNKHERASDPPPTTPDSVGQWHFRMTVYGGPSRVPDLRWSSLSEVDRCAYGCWPIALAVAVVMDDRRVSARSIRFSSAVASVARRLNGERIAKAVDIAWQPSTSTSRSACVP
jgi:hypothetical protein